MKKNYVYFLVIFIMILLFAGCKKHEDITGDTTSPVISNVQYTINSATTVTITWVTDEPATSQILYGIVDDEINQKYSVEDTNKIIEHSIILNDLKGVVIYYFQTISRDESGNLSMSDKFTFRIPIPINYPPWESGDLNKLVLKETI